MNESGTYSCFVSPEHTNVISLIGRSGEIASVRDTDVRNVTRQPCSISIFSIDDSETEYPAANSAAGHALYYPYSGTHTEFNNAYTYTSNSATTGSPVAIVQLNGVAGNTFLGEYITHVEYSGVIPQPMATPTEADQRGYEVVSAAAMQLPLRKQSNPFAPPLKLLMEGVKDVVTALKPIAVSKIAQIGAAMLL